MQHQWFKCHNIFGLSVICAPVIGLSVSDVLGIGLSVVITQLLVKAMLMHCYWTKCFLGPACIE